MVSKIGEGVNPQPFQDQDPEALVEDQSVQFKPKAIGSASLGVKSIAQPVKASTEWKPSILSEWKKQHKIEKHQGTEPLAYVFRAVSLIAMGAIALLSGLLVIGYNAWTAFKEWHAVNYKPNSTLAVIRQMKAKEQADKFKTMQSVLSDFNLTALGAKAGAAQLTLGLEAMLMDSGEIQKIRERKAARFIMRELAKEGVLTPEWIKALEDPAFFNHLIIEQDNLKRLDELKHFLDSMVKKGLPQKDIHKINWSEFYRKMNKEIVPRDREKLHHEVEEFERSLKIILNILKTPEVEVDPPGANAKFIVELRKALKNPVYEALKEDISHPAVHLLQRFASDMWNKAPSIDAYSEVGRTLVEHAEQEQVEASNGKHLANQLEQSYQQVARTHWTDSGANKLLYAASHPRQAIGSLASEGGLQREAASAVRLGVYDSHGKLANNPSLQGTTTMNWTTQGKKHQGEVRNCYGGSPTIGDYIISPEFEAVVQAAENNQLLPLASRDKNIPLTVAYNNLQNLDKKHGEGPRSRTIMLLNQKYPLSFRGTTFSKDSAMYLMPHDEDVIWKEGEGPEAFGQAMHDQMARSFNPVEKGHGFYFPGSYEDDWKEVFEKVIANANKHFGQLAVPQNIEERRQMQGAYQEYVYSMLNAINEMKSLQDLANREIEDPVMMAISACKENIDRGGMENTKYVYLRLPDDYPPDKRQALIMGIMHSRALSARDRVILKKRMPQVLNFMRNVEPQQFKASITQFFKDLGYVVQDLEYEVALEPVKSPRIV